MTLLQAALALPYVAAYALAPDACHAAVAALEAATVAALTAALADLDAGRLPGWRSLPVSAPARKYWRLPVRGTSGFMTRVLRRRPPARLAPPACVRARAQVLAPPSAGVSRV